MRDPLQHPAALRFMRELHARGEEVSYAEAALRWRQWRRRVRDGMESLLEKERECRWRIRSCMKSLARFNEVASKALGK